MGAQAASVGRKLGSRKGATTGPRSDPVSHR